MHATREQPVAGNTPVHGDRGVTEPARIGEHRLRVRVQVGQRHAHEIARSKRVERGPRAVENVEKRFLG